MKYMYIVLLIILNTHQITAPGLYRKENNQIIYAFQDDLINEYLKTAPFTPDHLRLALEINVEHPEIVYKQAIIETGWFKSQSFTKYNNLFGMKLPKHRRTLATGKALGHAIYNHWYDAVLDYKLYQRYYIERGHEISDYYVFLDNAGYSTSGIYTQILRQL